MTARPVGILMLDTRFPRIPGDIGNPASFDVPVIYRTVPEATVDRVVAPADRALALLPAFLDGALALEAGGAAAITTSCGFLSVVQGDLARALRVPVVTSSLYLYPLLAAMTGGRRIGILTADDDTLSAAHLEAAGIGAGATIAVAGLQGSAAFAGSVLADAPTLDAAALSRDTAAVAVALLEAYPDIAAFLFECTNLQPYAGAVQAATGRPVFGINDVVHLLARGTGPGHATA